MYKDGYISFNKSATDAAIHDAKQAGSYCNEINTLLTSISSNSKCSEIFGSNSTLTNLNDELTGIIGIEATLTEMKEKVLEYCENEELNVDLLECGYMLVDANKFGYAGYLYIPPGYTSTKGLPLLVYLNGSAERTKIDRLNKTGIGALLKSGYDMDAVVYVPTFSEGHGEDTNNLHNAINKVAEMYRDDENRISLWGYSIGGSVAVSLAVQHPNYYANLVMWGISANSRAKELAASGTNVISFMGSKEKFYSATVGMYNKLIENGANAVLYRINGGNHAASYYNGTMTKELIYDVLHIKKGEVIEFPNGIQEMTGNSTLGKGLLYGIEEADYKSIKTPNYDKTESLQIDDILNKYTIDEENLENTTIETTNNTTSDNVINENNIINDASNNIPKRSGNISKISNNVTNKENNVNNISNNVTNKKDSTNISIDTNNNIIPENKFKEFMPKISEGYLGVMEISNQHVSYEILNIKDDTYDKFIESLKKDGYCLNEEGAWIKDNHIITVIKTADNSSLNITLKEI